MTIPKALDWLADNNIPLPADLHLSLEKKGYLKSRFRKHLPGQHDQITHGHGDSGNDGGNNEYNEFEKASDMREFGNGFTSSVSFTDDETNSLINYKSEGYSEINNALRNDDDEYSLEVENIDNAINKSYISENVIAYRGVSSYEVDGLEIGDSFSDKAFVSTSLNYNTAMEFSEKYADESFSAEKTYIKIEIEKGTNGIYMEADNIAPEAREEYEILLPRDSTFEVTEINQYNDYKEVVVKVLK